MTSPVSSLLDWLRTPPVALRNVLESPRRSAMAIGGMAFALIMVFLQLGFLEAVRITARVNYDVLDFDIALLSPDFEQFYDPGSFPRQRLDQARAVAGVVEARPLWMRMDLWRCPTPPENEGLGLPGLRERSLEDSFPSGVSVQRRALLVLGIDLDSNPFREPQRSEVDAHAARLRLPDRVLLNRLSNPDFGAGRIAQFDGWELGRHRVQVIGTFALPHSFGADATVLGSRRTFLETRFPNGDDDRVHFGLIKVRPGTVEATIEELRARLPSDVVPQHRSELYAREAHYWVRQTATGLIFSFGVGVTLLVAAVVVYQVLSNDVRNRLPEYATLKAIGYPDSKLAQVVMAQAIIYGILAFLPALALSRVIYHVTERVATIPMVLTPSNVVLVFALMLLAGIVSGLLTIGKLRSANPADLF